MKQLATLLSLVLVIVFPNLIAAQSGILSGVVIDAETGEPLIGANIMLEDTNIGQSTNLEGEFQLMNVRPGTYNVIIRYVGYASKTIEDVLVEGDRRTTLEIELQEQAFEGEEVTVRATRDAVRRDRTSSESRVNRTQLDNLPVQELGEVLNLQAGVTESSTGEIHIRGGRSSEVAYIVDGIRVTDDYDRSQGVRVENNSIEELQVVSGAYNAEYGQAMSGIINISTRSGSNNFRGEFRTRGGDYFASDASLYDGIPGDFSNAEPTRLHNFEGSISGPIVEDRLTFFVSARRNVDDGWFLARNAYTPYGPTLENESGLTLAQRFDSVPASNPVNRFGDRVDEDLPWIEIHGTQQVDGEEFLYYTDTGRRDSSLTKVTQFESWGGQGNLQFDPMSGLRFNIIGNWGLERGDSFDGRYDWKLIPGGIPSFERNNYYVNFRTTITPSANTYITLNNAMRYNHFQRRLFDDLNDPRYFNFGRVSDLPSEYAGQAGRFNIVGTDNNVEERTTRTFITKAEITSQVTEHHMLKGGIEYKHDFLVRDQFSLQQLGDNVIPLDRTDGLGIPIREGRNRENWSRDPWMLSAFLQDRIEISNLVINAGFRFEYFQPNAQIPADSRNPEIFNVPTQRGDDFWTDASPKIQLSPRLGVAYPITQTGVLHFSYGYFLQIPEYELMFNGDQIILPQQSGTFGIFGNPDLEPQQTIQYELGLQQELFPGSVLEISGYFRDIRDWVSSGPTQPTALPGTRYGTWINRDFATVKGLNVQLNQQIGGQLNMTIDYTYSIADGTNSDPAAEFFAAVGRGDEEGRQLTKFLQPLDWDRRHQLNSTLFYTGQNWGASLVQRFQTGEPYTPGAGLPTRTGPNALRNVRENSQRAPMNITFDINLYRGISIGGYTLRTNIEVRNLLDTRNPQFVFGDSGTAEAPLPVNQPGQVDSGFYDNPFFYDQPRRVQVGMEIRFN